MRSDEPGASQLGRRPAWLIGTWFGCGYFPKGPGTAASLVALLIALALVRLGMPAAGFAALSLLALAPAIWASGVVAVQSGRKDPQIVVVDEVLGQWLTLSGAARFSFRSFLLAFLLFRLF